MIVEKAYEAAYDAALNLVLIIFYSSSLFNIGWAQLLRTYKG